MSRHAYLWLLIVAAPALGAVDPQPTPPEIPTMTVIPEQNLHQHLAAEPLVSDLSPIPLQLGVNRISQFSPDGRDANIVLAWQDEERGRGHDVFLVTLQDAGGRWRSVSRTQDGLAFDFTITDIPNRGDDMLRAVRFARGKVDGQDAGLLLIATRNEGDGPTSVVYDVYRLMKVAGLDVFQQISSRRLPGRYCNADMALTVASGLPLRTSYRGPRSRSGDFTKDGCREAGGRSTSAGRNRESDGSKLKGDSLSTQQKEALFQQFLSWRATPPSKLEQ